MPLYEFGNRLQNRLNEQPTWAGGLLRELLTQAALPANMGKDDIFGMSDVRGLMQWGSEMGLNADLMALLGQILPTFGDEQKRQAHREKMPVFYKNWMQGIQPGPKPGAIPPGERPDRSGGNRDEKKGPNVDYPRAPYSSPSTVTAPVPEQSRQRTRSRPSVGVSQPPQAAPQQPTVQATPPGWQSQASQVSVPTGGGGFPTGVTQSPNVGQGAVNNSLGGKAAKSRFY